MASAEQMKTLNDQLISALKDSFAQLNTSITNQSEQSHNDLAAVNSSMKSLEHSNSSGNSKGASALGHMPNFSGQENDAREFLDQFEYYANFCKWSDKEKLAAIPLALIGSAKAWLFTLTESYSTYDEFMFLFKKRFLSQTDNWVLRRELSTRTQKPGERVLDYSTDVIKRCRRLNLPDNEQMFKFIEGLLPDIRDFVILREPKSLDEAISHAKIKATVSPNNVSTVTRKDLEQLQSNMLTALTNVASASVNASDFDTHSKPRFPRPPHDDIDIQTMIKQQVHEELKKTRFPNQHNNKPLKFTQNGGFGRPTRAVNGEPICYTCHKVGHTSAYCQQNRFQNNRTPRNQYSARPGQRNFNPSNSNGARMNGKFVPQQRQ